MFFVIVFLFPFSLYISFSFLQLGIKIPSFNSKFLFFSIASFL